MIGKAELRKVFPRPFVTKGEVKDKMGFSSYNEIRPFFHKLDHIGQRYLTEDVIERIREYVEYGD